MEKKINQLDFPTLGAYPGGPLSPLSPFGPIGPYIKRNNGLISLHSQFLKLNWVMRLRTGNPGRPGVPEPP